MLVAPEKKTFPIAGNLHPPGIYFGMSMEEYHADWALGSSSIRQLATNPASYWWNSHLNPLRPADKDTPATARGTAVHTLVLYGEKEFDRSYMRGANNTEDMTPAEKSANTKKYNALAAAKGLIALPAVTYDSVAIAAAMIAKNPKLSTALVGGLNEVSIFWLDPDNGIPKKARIDCLKPRGVGDLKSLANKFEKPFPRACIDSIVNYRYDVQACHYLRARALLPDLYKTGKVFGASPEEIEKLEAVAAEPVFAWQWVWWQAEGAPVTFSKVISPANPLLEISAATIERADRNYLDFMERFGPNNMWLLQDEPSELYIEELPPYFARD